MTAVIYGLRFDTDKAELIGEYSFGYPSDFRYIEESLYRTVKGNWLLAGQGGVSSKYAELVSQNTYGPGSSIKPLSPDEALEWCETHGIDAGTIAQYFKVVDAKKAG